MRPIERYAAEDQSMDSLVRVRYAEPLKARNLLAIVDPTSLLKVLWLTGLQRIMLACGILSAPTTRGHCVAPLPAGFPTTALFPRSCCTSSSRSAPGSPLAQSDGNGKPRGASLTPRSRSAPTKQSRTAGERFDGIHPRARRLRGWRHAHDGSVRRERWVSVLKWEKPSSS